MSKEIRFIDTRYHDLFTVEDGEKIVVTQFDGDRLIEQCRYIDETHFEAGRTVFHICEFAERMEKNGAVYAPEIVRPGDCIDTYEIDQIPNTRAVEYCFRPFGEAEKQIRRSDYRRIYVGMLAPQTSMEYLYVKHNRDGRPFGRQMRSLSVSDVIILNRAGKQQAYYVDNMGFQEVPGFFGKEPEKVQPERNVRKRNREYER